VLMSCLSEHANMHAADVLLSVNKIKKGGQTVPESPET
jgi:hypothetical protein